MVVQQYYKSGSNDFYPMYTVRYGDSSATATDSYNNHYIKVTNEIINTTSASSYGWQDYSTSGITIKTRCDSYDNFYNWGAASGATTTAADNYTIQWELKDARFPSAPVTPQQRFREIIADRHAPAIRVRGNPHDIWEPSRHPLGLSRDAREIRARDTLRRVIGEDKFRSFLKTGFVSARNTKSGYFYQIYPGHGLTFVYKNGKMVERLCVYLRGDFPPTDGVVVRYLMALNNEKRLWELANKHGPLKQQVAVGVDLNLTRPLTEVYDEIVKKVA